MRYFKQKNFLACYGRLDEDSKKFDIEFWQRQGSKAIFEAAYDMVKDYLLLKRHCADEPQFQRTIESFEKAPV